MLASFLVLVDFNAISWEGVKFRGRACQRRDLVKRAKYNEKVMKTIFLIRIKLRLANFSLFKLPSCHLPFYAIYQDCC
jgi:hypothetical protein